MGSFQKYVVAKRGSGKLCAWIDLDGNVERAFKVAVDETSQENFTLKKTKLLNLFIKYKVEEGGRCLKIGKIFVFNYVGNKKALFKSVSLEDQFVI